MLAGLRSCFEEAEIGGGTLYTTALDLYEDGSCEFGSHDVGQRGRQVTRRARRGQSFSEAFFWGGYEYFKGTWAAAEPPETTAGTVDASGTGGDGGGRESVGGGEGRYFRVTLTSMRTQPSDPYNSDRTEREVTGSFLVREALVDMPSGAGGGGSGGNSTEGGESVTEGGTQVSAVSEREAAIDVLPSAAVADTPTISKVQALVLSEFEGEPHGGVVRFKELRVASVVVEGKQVSLLPAGVVEKTTTIEGCEGVMGDASVQAEFRLEQAHQKEEASATAAAGRGPVGLVT
jgi:hypothetical protein